MTRLSGEARKIVAATSSTFGQSEKSALGMAGRLAGVSMTEGATALTRMPFLGDLLGQRDGEGGDGRLAGGVGHHAGAAAPFQRRAAAIDNAPAGAGIVAAHGVHRGAAAQRAAHEVHVDLLPQRRHTGLAQRRRSKPAGEVDRGPQRRDPLIEPGDGRRIGETAGDGERHALMLAQPQALRLRLVAARHVADGAGIDQRRDDGGAERAGPPLITT